MQLKEMKSENHKDAVVRNVDEIWGASAVSRTGIMACETSEVKE